jgi:hypothetical protein
VRPVDSLSTYPGLRAFRNFDDLRRRDSVSTQTIEADVVVTPAASTLESTESAAPQPCLIPLQQYSNNNNNNQSSSTSTSRPYVTSVHVYNNNNDQDASSADRNRIIRVIEPARLSQQDAMSHRPSPSSTTRRQVHFTTRSNSDDQPMCAGGGSSSGTRGSIFISSSSSSASPSSIRPDTWRMHRYCSSLI